jgi:hypothetical protein
MLLASGTASLIGCRRPFSPSAERLFAAQGQDSMKKSTQQTSTIEPIGIIITTGARTPIEPLVRAYVWGPAPDEPQVTDGTRAA